MHLERCTGVGTSTSQCWQIYLISVSAARADVAEIFAAETEVRISDLPSRVHKVADFSDDPALPVSAATPIKLSKPRGKKNKLQTAPVRAWLAEDTTVYDVEASDSGPVAPVHPQRTFGEGFSRYLEYPVPEPPKHKPLQGMALRMWVDALGRQIGFGVWATTAFRLACATWLTRLDVG